MPRATILARLETLLSVAAFIAADASYVDGPYDNFWFSVKNRAGACSSPEANCHKLDGASHPIIPWTIYGLWPVKGRRNLSFHHYDPATFDIGILKPIRVDLDRYWPSHNSTSNEVLWTHEFKAYGSYAMYQRKRITNALEYFNTALTLYRDFGIARWLSDRRILPSNKRPVSRGDIERAISLGYTSSGFYLFCKGQKNGLDILHEVRLCLDRNIRPGSGCVQPAKTCTTEGIWYLEDSMNATGTPSGSFVAAVTLIALFMSRN